MGEYHKFKYPGMKKSMAGPSKEVEEEIVGKKGKKKGKRDYSILMKILKGFKQVKKMGGKSKKKDNPGHSY